MARPPSNFSVSGRECMMQFFLFWRLDVRSPETRCHLPRLPTRESLAFIGAYLFSLEEAIFFMILHLHAWHLLTHPKPASGHAERKLSGSNESQIENSNDLEHDSAPRRTDFKWKDGPRFQSLEWLKTFLDACESPARLRIAPFRRLMILSLICRRSHQVHLISLDLTY